MHILYLDQSFCPPDGAGSTRTYETVRRWVRAGHTVTVVTSSVDMPETYGVGCYTLDGIDLNVVRASRSDTANQTLQTLWFSAAATWRTVCVDAPDLVVVAATSSLAMVPGFLASVVKAAPLVFEVQDVLVAGAGSGRQSIGARMSSLARKFMYRFSDCLVALDSEIKNALISSGVAEDKIAVIPDGCDSDLFRVPADHGAALLDVYPYLRDGPLVVYGGTLSAKYGLGYMAKLAAAVASIDPDIRFVICGSGPARADVRAEAEHVNVFEQNLWIIPPLPKHRMPELLSAATVSISLFDKSDVSAYRSFAKMFDALAAGKPLVFNHAGAHADLIESRSAGLLLPSHNIETAARDLAEFVRDGEALSRAGEQATALADSRFNRDKVTSEYRLRLEDVAQAHPAPQRRRARSLVAKRVFDFVLAGLALVVLSPVLILLSFIVLFSMGWPILFSQTRPGLGGRPFRFHKFRTMENAVDGAGNILPDGDRLTPLGRFLRRTSLDELPELFNVLTGDMSLVGPRPLLMEYLPYYDTEQARRHTVRPGITGSAQVNGRNDLSWEEKFKLDVWYVDNRTLWLDIKILCKTAWVVITGQGVSAPGHDSMPRFDEIMARRQGAEDI